MINTFILIIPVFLLILTGLILKKNFIQSSEFWTSVESLTYYVLFPALLILKLSQADFESVNMEKSILVLVLATMSVGAIAWLCKYFLKIEDKLFSSVFQGSTRYNSYVFLGLSQSLFGDEGIALSGIYIAYMIILTNCLSVAVLNHYTTTSKKSFFSVGKKILQNPLIIGALIGLILNFSKVEIPLVISTYMKFLGSSASALSLLAVGAGLTFRMQRARRNAVFLSTSLKLVCFPIIVFGLVQYLAIDDITGKMAMLYACLPCAGNSYILARQMGGDAEAMASIITLTTLGAGLSVPVFL